MTRRDLIRMAVALPSAGLFTRFRAMAAAELKKVKITNIRAMAIQNIAGNCLIRIDTDAGLTGYGEAGSTGPMARARIATMRNLLVGKDPLTIEVHFHNMTSLMHTYMAHIPTISGIDMALVGPRRQNPQRAGEHAARRPVPRVHSNVLARGRSGHGGQSVLPRLVAAHQGNAGRLHGIQEQHRPAAGRAVGAVREHVDDAAASQRGARLMRTAAKRSATRSISPSIAITSWIRRAPPPSRKRWSR